MSLEKFTSKELCKLAKERLLGFRYLGDEEVASVVNIKSTILMGEAGECCHGFQKVWTEGADAFEKEWRQSFCFPAFTANGIGVCGSPCVIFMYRDSGRRISCISSREPWAWGSTPDSTKCLLVNHDIATKCCAIEP